MRFLLPAFLFLSVASSGVLAHADDIVPLPPSPRMSEVASGEVETSETQNKPKWARFASSTGTGLFVASGVLLPLVADGNDGDQHALRAADSLITSTLITKAIKKVVHSKRPDGSDYESFPSGHATVAFSIASMQAHFHPDQAIFWYLGATAISVSRVKLRRHRVRDVVAGAVIGIATSEIEYRQRRGLVLFPFIHGGGNTRQKSVAGLSFGGSF